MKKILCIRLDNMGDLLMTTPAIRAVKDKNNYIVLLCSKKTKEIAELIPEIDKIITYDAPWIQSDNTYFPSASLQKKINKIKRYHFDEAIIFTVYSQSSLPASLFCYLCNIPKRIAYSHENPNHLLTTWIPDPEPQKIIRHEVKRQLLLAKMAGYSMVNDKLSLKEKLNEKNKTMQILKSKNIDLEKPFVIVHPGASDLQRRYSLEKFSDIVLYLTNRLGIQVILSGNKEEVEICNSIRSKIKQKCLSLAGKLTISQFISLIRLSSLLITNNTGPMHIAAAFKKPVIVFYADTNLQHTPWQTPQKIFYFNTFCKACQRNICIKKHKKIKEINFSEVKSAINNFLFSKIKLYKNYEFYYNSYPNK